jgi:hypothetical protein
LRLTVRIGKGGNNRIRDAIEEQAVERGIDLEEARQKQQETIVEGTSADKDNKSS